MNDALKQINEFVEKESAFVDNMFAEMGKVIVGQQYLLERLLIGVLTGGHLLVEGVPGLAKTLSISTLAQCLHLGFKRIQFTPDLLPSDIVGNLIYNQAKQEFVAKRGPIFANIVLADEINRAPAKVQSALLEAMQEGQVTIGEKSFKLEDPFLVLATQNPIEQEGTYPLPEAQTDRFLMKLRLTYPSKSEEKQILKRMANGADTPQASVIIKRDDILRARQVVNKVYVDEKIRDYVIDLIFATRDPESYDIKGLGNYLEYGASPRASIALIQAARAHAFIKRRGYVVPEDIKSVGKDVLRHRLVATFEAEAEGLSTDQLVDRVFAEIEVP